MRLVDDNSLVALFWARNERALAVTAAQYGGYCAQIAYNITKNREDTEECVNDSYLRVWNSIPTDRPQMFKPYIGKITRNLAISRYRRDHAKKRGEGARESVYEELADCIPGGFDTEKQLEDKEIAKAISTFLRTEKEEARILFVRRYWYAESIAKLSEDFGFSESKVKSALFRTRNALREYLEKEEISL